MKALASVLVAAGMVAAAVPGRAEPLTALTSTGSLVTFDSATPGTVGSSVAVTGLISGDVLTAIDRRPIDSVLVGLGYNSTDGSARLYTINTTTGAVTPFNSPFTLGTGLTSVRADFNPAANALRISTNASAANNRRAPSGGTGAYVTDTDLNPGAPFH